MEGTHRVWVGDRWEEVAVPAMAGTPIMVPNVAALVFPSTERSEVLLQRRDKPHEPVRGRLELPGGRWEAGERPDAAVRREVLEETGVRVTAVAAAVTIDRHQPHIATATAHPVAVVCGLEGAYPSLHVLFECYGEGDPRPLPGEVADPRWWDVADVLDLLEREAHAFIAQTAAMLRAGLVNRS